MAAMLESVLRSLHSRCRDLPALGFVALIMLVGIPSFADGFKVNVTVETERAKTFMSPVAVGVQTSISDNNLMTQDTVKMIRGAGVTALRYPGGIISGVYHWSSNKQTNWHGTDKTNFWIPPANHFGNFAALLAQTGAQGIITVNYGSNLVGSGGGEPAEAAAWVAYANGDPNDPKVIGRDSTGYDWKTVGYWASVRASQPLAIDDGINFLRIGRPRPLHIVFWEIGSDVFANGYYNKHKEGGTVEDLHFRYGANKGESEKSRLGNRALGPAAYAENFLQFAKAMKAVDPRIRIGAVLVTSKDNDWAPDWNSNVLKTVGHNADFLAMHWSPSSLLPDWKEMNVPEFLNTPSDLPISASLLEMIRKYCAPTVQMAFTELAPGWGSLKEPMTKGLFAAEAFSSLIESGFVNATWSDLRNDFLDSNNAPQPAWFGMLSTRIILMPNDVVVASNASRSSVSVHAVKRADGNLAIMLINKDPKDTADVKLAVKGMQLAPTGLRFDYGPSNPPAGAALARSPINDAGSTFTVTVPPYTITTLRLSKTK